MAFLDFLAPAASIVGGLLGFKGASDQNKANSAIAAKQMAFQERMSNTSYQRSMADMRKAGLNPILAYKTGGATTPGGAGIPAVSELANIDNPVSSALAAKKTVAELKQTTANIDNIKMNTQKAHQEARLAKQNVTLATTEDRNRRQLFDALVEQATQAKIQTKSSAADFLVKQEDRRLMWDWLTSKAGKAFWKADMIGRAVNPMTSAFRNVR